MITKQEFSAGVLYFKGLSGLTAAPTREYLQACYGELANQYTPETLQQAARDIAATEETYGQYPSLRLWLKHCVSHQTAMRNINGHKKRFLDCLAEYIDCDTWLAADMEQTVKNVGGERGRVTLESLGYSLPVVRGLAKANMPGILAQIAKAWDTVVVTPNAVRLEMDKLKQITVDK